MFKICAIVSTFFPNLIELENNINSYLPWVDKLIIWENTPEGDSKISELSKSINNEKIEVRTTGQNEFLARPFNICIDWAKLNGFTHILTMDQDSRFVNGHFKDYIEKIKQIDNQTVAIFAPNAQNFEKELEVMERDSVISSGSIFPIDKLLAAGLFNEDFLIYHVDTEFSIRVRKMGFKILSFTKIELKHEEGYKRKNKIGFILNNYSAQSTYYIIRNSILLWKMYPDRFAFGEKYAFYKYKVFYRMAKMIFEVDRIRKLKAIFLGLIHGYLSKKGRFDI